MKNIYQANNHFNEKQNSIESKNPNEIEINIHHNDDEYYINENFSMSTLMTEFWVFYLAESALFSLRK